MPFPHTILVSKKCHPDRSAASCAARSGGIAGQSPRHQQSVIPTGGSRRLRAVVEGSRQDPRVLPPTPIFDFQFSIFVLRPPQAFPAPPF
jgi:hypothetical protein